MTPFISCHSRQTAFLLLRFLYTLQDANNHSLSSSPDADHRAPEPTPSLTPPHSPTATQTVDKNAPLASLKAVTFQPVLAPHAYADPNTRPQRRKNLQPYLD